MNENRIEVGDTVKVLFATANYLLGTVDYTPVATGDSWIIIDHQGSVPVYVQQFDCMILQRKGE